MAAVLKTAATLPSSEFPFSTQIPVDLSGCFAFCVNDETIMNPGLTFE
jgi:hypothetical protein